ncbi:hypothetical protein C8F04DRAFT_1127216, partial [Mycena alexandri]
MILRRMGGGGDGGGSSSGVRCWCPARRALRSLCLRLLHLTSFPVLASCFVFLPSPSATSLCHPPSARVHPIHTHSRAYIYTPISISLHISLYTACVFILLVHVSSRTFLSIIPVYAYTKYKYIRCSARPLHTLYGTLFESSTRLRESPKGCWSRRRAGANRADRPAGLGNG